MLTVFNEKFAHLWDASGIRSWQSDPVYSAHGPYAFPRLPDIKQSSEATFVMRYSRVPRSPEFTAIPWVEGRATLGGCPSGRICARESSVPILIARFDFDNDGSSDTVVKEGFFNGYGHEYGGGTGSALDEHLIVWRGQSLDVSGVPNLWVLEHPDKKVSVALIASGTYLRPFIYHGVTYVTKYVQDIGANEFQNLPGRPRREDMLIVRFHVRGLVDKKAPVSEWDVETLCDYRMKQLKAR